MPIPIGTYGTIWISTDSSETLLQTDLLARRMPGGKIDVLSDVYGFRQKTFLISKNQLDKNIRTYPIDNKNLKYPASLIEKRIAKSWAEVLNIPLENITIEDNFFLLGGNSLKAIRVAIDLKDIISLADFMRNSTLKSLAKLIEQKVDKKHEENILRKISNDIIEEYSLICFPYAGGASNIFDLLALQLEKMSSKIAVYSLDLPSHNFKNSDDQKNFMEITELATLLCSEINRNFNKPILLWGHCIGSALALETARLLENNRNLLHVFLAGKLFHSKEVTQENLIVIKEMSNQKIIDWLINETGYSEFNDLQEQYKNVIVTNFRHDACSANRYFEKAYKMWKTKKLSVPISVVFAKDDSLTIDYENEYMKWSFFGNNVFLHEINDGGHYFCQTRPSQVANLIDSQLKKYR